LAVSDRGTFVTKADGAITAIVEPEVTVFHSASVERAYVVAVPDDPTAIVAV
jgi:hypothetical protein